jgi:CBS domain-containing protein
MQSAVATTPTTTVAASDFRFSQLHTAMASTKLSTLPWTTKKGLMTSVTTAATVKEALELLTRENILAVPVFDAETAQFKGFCDFQMLVRFVVRLADGQIPSSAWWDENDRIRTTTVWDLVQGCGTAGRAIEGEWTPPVSEIQSVYDAVQAMALSGNHRIGITNASGTVTALMTQSVVIRWLSEHLSQLGAARDAKVSELRPYTALACIDQDQTALRAFELMDEKRTSENGVAVVDASGKLVDVISTHDLRGITPGAVNFDNLYSTVKQFKRDVNQRFNAGKQQGLYSCTSSDTLESVIMKMTAHHVHRLVVVNNKHDMAPIDMISQTDVLRFVVQHSKPKFF